MRFCEEFFVVFLIEIRIETDGGRTGAARFFRIAAGANKQK